MAKFDPFLSLDCAKVEGVRAQSNTSTQSFLFGPLGFWTMAPLRRIAKFRPHALHPGAIQGKEGIKFCHLATLEEQIRDRRAVTIEGSIVIVCNASR